MPVEVVFYGSGSLEESGGSEVCPVKLCPVTSIPGGGGGVYKVLSSKMLFLDFSSFLLIPSCGFIPLISQPSCRFNHPALPPPQYTTQSLSLPAEESPPAAVGVPVIRVALLPAKCPTGSRDVNIALAEPLARAQAGAAPPQQASGILWEDG